jgi:hypothetical protein
MLTNEKPPAETGARRSWASFVVVDPIASEIRFGVNSTVPLGPPGVDEITPGIRCV